MKAFRSLVRLLTKLFETRIAAELVPIRIDAQERGSHRWSGVGDAEQVLQSRDRAVLVPEMGFDPGQTIFIGGPRKASLEEGSRAMACRT